MKNEIALYLTTAQAADALGLSKKGLSKAAQREGWPRYQVGNTHLWRIEDVREYRDHCHRTEIVKELGWRGRGKYRVSDVDIACPVCEAFAVEWPAPPYLPKKFRCLKGHEGEL